MPCLRCHATCTLHTKLRKPSQQDEARRQWNGLTRRYSQHPDVDNYDGFWRLQGAVTFRMLRCSNGA